jgi:hypothetical protein
MSIILFTITCSSNFELDICISMSVLYYIYIILFVFLYTVSRALFHCVATYHLQMSVCSDHAYPGHFSSQFVIPFLCCQSYYWLYSSPLVISTSKPIFINRVYPQKFWDDSLSPYALCLTWACHYYVVQVKVETGLTNC